MSWYKLTEFDMDCIIDNYQTFLELQQNYVIPEGAETNNKYARYVEDMFPGESVLHVGCGTGYEVFVSKELGLNAKGITANSEEIDRGIKLGFTYSGDVSCGVAENIPAPDNCYNRVVACQIFEHMIAPIVFLKEQLRVLKPGGSIVLEWPPACAHSCHGADPQHIICYTPGQAWGLLLKAGFVDVELFYNDMTPIPEKNWWMGEQEKGYVIAKARKPE